MLVRALPHDFVLSGVHSTGQNPGRAVVLHGKWEVLGRRTVQGKSYWESTYLTPGSDVASAAKAKGDTFAPVVPDAEAIRSRGGTVQVKGYHRSNGTYVQPHTRGGRK